MYRSRTRMSPAPGPGLDSRRCYCEDLSGHLFRNWARQDRLGEPLGRGRAAAPSTLRREEGAIQATEATTIPHALAVAAQSYRGSEALVDGGSRLTFDQLWSEARNGAAGLIAAGVEAGDRVGIWAPNSATWVVASFAVYATGAVLVPINTRYRGAEAAHIIETAGVKVVLTVTDFLGSDFVGWLARECGPSAAAPGGHPQRPGSGPDHRVAGAVPIQRPAGPRCGDVASGRPVGGIPFGCCLHVGYDWCTQGGDVDPRCQRAHLCGVVGGGRASGWGPVSLCVPVFPHGGSQVGGAGFGHWGAALIPHAVFDVAEVMAKVAAERVTVLPGPPSVFQSILAHPGLEGFDLGSLRLAVTGAAVVPTEVVERMRSELHIDRVVTGYGLTETTGTVSMCRHDDPPEVIEDHVGRPLPGVEILIVDDSKRSVVTGEAGEILVRGFNVMKGYFADPAATVAAVDRDGWLWTGDIGLIDAAGNLRITDRKKDMFIVGGFNAYPAEIEKMMTGHPDLSQVAVIGVPDERLGEVGAAYVVARPGAHPNSEELISWCRARMANFKVPRRVHLVDELPLTPSGKVMKHVLRQQAGPQPTVGGIPLSDDSLGRLLLDHPAAPTEPLVCTITSEMSKLEFCQAARSVAADLVRVGSGPARPWRCNCRARPARRRPCLGSGSPGRCSCRSTPASRPARWIG